MSKTKEFLISTAGTLLVAIGIYFFKFPNKFSTGGVSGLSLVLGAAFSGLSPGTFVLAINILLLIIGFGVFGRSFGIKTAYCSMLSSLTVFLLEKIYPMSVPLTRQPLLELIFSVALPAVGSAILFNIGASTGGTDVIAMILKKYSSLDIGKALFCTDAGIALASGFIFGIETGMFSSLGLLSKALIVDNVIESINLSKYFTIITDYPEDVIRYINNTLHRGATECKCKGAFSDTEKVMILTVLSRPQSVLLRNYIKSIDKNAFIVITNTSDIIGKGFREIF